MNEHNRDNDHCCVGTSLNFSLVKGFVERIDKVLKDTHTHTHTHKHLPQFSCCDPQAALIANFQCKSAVSMRNMSEMPLLMQILGNYPLVARNLMKGC